MSIERYRALIEQLCLALGSTAPRGLYQSATLDAGGVEFTLLHGGLMVPDSVLMYCDFGELPQASRERILLRLLETNMHLFGQHSPAFTYDAQRNRIVLMCRLPTQQADLASMLELFEFFGGIARRWSKDHFLFG